MVEKALENGYQILEVDTIKTKDGKWIMSHDRNLERLTGLNKNVWEVNYDEIPPFRESIDFPYYNNDPLQNTLFPNKKMDFLESLFERIKNENLYVFLEVRAKDEKLLDSDLKEVVEISKKYGIKDRIFWGFTNKSVNKTYKKREGLKTYVSQPTVYFIIISFFLCKNSILL